MILLSNEKRFNNFPNILDIIYEIKFNWFLIKKQNLDNIGTNIAYYLML